MVRFSTSPALHSKIILNVGDYGFLALPDRYYRWQLFHVDKLFVILLFILFFYLPSFRFSLRLRVLWLLSLRFLLLSLRLLNFLLRLLFGC